MRFSGRTAKVVRLTREEQALIRDAKREAWQILIGELEAIGVPKRVMTLLLDYDYLSAKYESSVSEHGIVTNHEHKYLIQTAEALANRLGWAVHPINAEGYVIDPIRP